MITSGTLPAGGAIFEKHPVEGEPALFIGSVVVYAAESLEEVYKIIKSDIYAKRGVWDLEKIQVIPVSSSSYSPHHQKCSDVSLSTLCPQYVPAVREQIRKEN
ncbi:hypothetical protein CABS03_08641 [Colletotrichum abscissum]|uniref:YCII-related domain-containing protein n=2 Tax=Colletotrichum acutatum species complex TaxID=2707335 RepID=A0A9P9X1U2_9PEZI|nr:hypothetical protein CABS02_14065 [Colletotrichum abscissum]